MIENQRKILEMLSEGRLTVADAERLLLALGKGPSPAEAQPQGEGAPAGGGGPKYLRVLIDDVKDKANPAKVNIRIPIQLLRAGLKLQSLLPAEARARVNQALSEKGVGFSLDQLTSENIDSFIQAFSEMTVDVDAEGGLTKVKVFCE